MPIDKPTTLRKEKNLFFLRLLKAVRNRFRSIKGWFGVIRRLLKPEKVTRIR
jgi:hypothetical protein